MWDYMDDDQPILLLAYRRKPELFELKQSKWFLPSKQCDGAHSEQEQSGKTQKQFHFLKELFGN
jgi:hypothetical protein